MGINGRKLRWGIVCVVGGVFVRFLTIGIRVVVLRMVLVVVLVAVLVVVLMLLLPMPVIVDVGHRVGVHGGRQQGEAHAVMESSVKG
jgi:hypothetical protein